MKQLVNFQKKLILTSPKLSQKASKPTETSILVPENSYFVHFGVSVSQSKKLKCFRLAKKKACLSVSQSIAVTVRQP